MFAQNAIFPSKTPTEKEDIRPHLVSLRDTLLLFKPLDNDFDSNEGVQLVVSNKNQNTGFNGDMLPPEKLPRPAERNNPYDDEHLFINPDAFDYVISSGAEFHEIGGNNPSRFAKFLENTATIQMKCWGGFGNLFLPDIRKPLNVVTKIEFISNTAWISNIHILLSRMKTTISENFALRTGVSTQYLLSRLGFLWLS